MEKPMERALDLLAALAARLGTTADHLWPVLVRQAFLHGVVLLVVGVLLGGGLLLVCRLSARRSWELGEKREFSPQEGPLIAVAIVSGVVATVLLPLTLAGGVLRVLNPEFYALRYVLEALAGK